MIISTDVRTSWETIRGTTEELVIPALKRGFYADAFIVFASTILPIGSQPAIDLIQKLGATLIEPASTQKALRDIIANLQAKGSTKT